MKLSIPTLLICTSLISICGPANLQGATFALGTQPGIVAPTGRGGANTTFYGWDTFNEPTTRNVPINDSTPDIGTNPGGAVFMTTNGQDHVINSGNLYFISGTLAEQVTAVTSGTPGQGFTTVIAQAQTATGFGGFPAAVTLTIGGVAPTQYLQGLNSTNSGQFWAVWELSGNQSIYNIDIAGVPNQPHYSFDKFTIDTFWSSTGFQGDLMVQGVPEPSRAMLLLFSGLGLCLQRRRRTA